MNKYIVITSIFLPTEAVKIFSAMDDYKLIVVGDKKTPEEWNCKNVNYLSVSEQLSLGFALSEILPFHHYCRKMLGYLVAIKNGAEFIIDTDDDNIPKRNWRFPSFENEYDYISLNQGFINIYQLFTEEPIWPRGLPLHLINTKFDLDKYLELKDCKVGIWQGLADEDPDVDAIYRLTSDKPCYFKERKPVVLGSGTISPFNTQNTIIKKELFPLMYLPTYVTFRFTDILRGLVAQPLMWLYDYQLGFTDATVVQKRNPHDYMKDFISEIPMYQHCGKIVELVSAVISKSLSIENNLFNAYKSLLKEGIICNKEMVTLEAWLNDLSKPGAGG
ncbi:MAG TPA: STELLO glycosyltransferase family protein [Chitinophagaceae bacterium]|nr:STELLO glycosyltransferase family protein [Chitinophagaceae bacterium]